MHWRTVGLVLLLSLFTAWLGWQYFTKPEGAAIVLPTPMVATPSPTPTPEATREDIATLIAAPLTISGSQIATRSGNLTFIQSNKPGFVTLFGENIATRSALQAITILKETTSPMPLVAVDHEGGRVQRLRGTGFTRVPAWQAVCEMSVAEKQEVFVQSALELQRYGINIVFAPVIDLAENNPILRDRICSNDPAITSAAAQEMIVQYRQNGVYPVIKHYPGIGETTRDLHNSLDAVLTMPRELPVFQTLLRLFPTIGVMSTHVLVSGFSEEAPCSLNEKCIQPLRTEFPQAVIFTDALEMDSARTGYDLLSQKSLEQVSREALLAGNHVLVYGRDVTGAELEKVLETLYREYGTNEVLREKIDQALVQVRTLRTELENQNKSE